MRKNQFHLSVCVASVRMYNRIGIKKNIAWFTCSMIPILRLFITSSSSHFVLPTPPPWHRIDIRTFHFLEWYTNGRYGWKKKWYIHYARRSLSNYFACAHMHKKHSAVWLRCAGAMITSKKCDMFQGERLQIYLEKWLKYSTLSNVFVCVTILKGTSMSFYTGCWQRIAI